MGAQTFGVIAKGKTARDAFAAARDAAAYEHGHGGYTGTIAEKSEFKVLATLNKPDALAFSRKLMDDDDPRISDKWGPAGCVDMGNGEYLFFGWASS